MYAFLKATVVSKLDFGGIKGNFPLFNTTSYGAPVWKKQIENEKRFDATRTNGRKMYESGIIKKHSNLCLFLKSGECHGVPNWKLLVIPGYICHPWITDFQSAMWSNAFSLKTWIYQNLNFDEPDGPSLGILDLWKHAACLAQKREFGGLFNPQKSNVSCNKEEGLVSGEHIFFKFYIPAACQRVCSRVPSSNAKNRQGTSEIVPWKNLSIHQSISCIHLWMKRGHLLTWPAQGTPAWRTCKLRDLK